MSINTQNGTSDDLKMLVNKFLKGLRKGELNNINHNVQTEFEKSGGKFGPREKELIYNYIWDLIIKRYVSPGNTSNYNLPDFTITDDGRKFGYVK